MFYFSLTILILTPSIYFPSRFLHYSIRKVSIDRSSGVFLKSPFDRSIVSNLVPFGASLILFIKKKSHMEQDPVIRELIAFFKL